ncbi:MAG: LPS export ABC transporter protein LptC [Rubritalea sp.]|jgi:LPS export ABC transporter protein LptC
MNPNFHLLKITITALAVICFFASCNDNLKEIQKMEVASNAPVGEVENMLLKHTDSGSLKLTLEGKTMLDFSNNEFPYTEFPDGIKVKVFEYRNKITQVTTITANSGILYDQTHIVDLRENVKIVTSDGNTFVGEQLYWDQTSKWIFTNQKFKTFLVNNKEKKSLGSTTGTILDARENLSQLVARDPSDKFITPPNNE